MNMSELIKNRYEFMLFYDVENGNPNGDPDAGNMPRIDPETGHGIVTDVCLKRKIRNYVELIKQDEVGYKIYIKEDKPLNLTHQVAYNALGLDYEKSNKSQEDLARAWMCKNYYDVRTFGAVMSTGQSCGQVRGPVQINFSRSIDPIIQQEVTITRVVQVDKPEGTIGRKHIVPYALYKAEGFISAKLANDDTKGTGFTEADLDLFWEALVNMFEHDRSAARGKMISRKLFIFKHASELGNAPSHLLFDSISVQKNNGDEPTRHFSDYKIFVDRDVIPEQVTFIERI
jgi:CRISPR-associated protein Csd2